MKAGDRVRPARRVIEQLADLYDCGAYRGSVVAVEVAPPCIRVAWDGLPGRELGYLPGELELEIAAPSAGRDTFAGGCMRCYILGVACGAHTQVESLRWRE